MSESTESLARVQLSSGRTIALARHDAGGDSVVIFCHGFRGERTGPNRTFVRAARQLAAIGVSSLRFDQFGSGDSDGEFIESRFVGWIDTITELVDRERSAGKRVALFGQSMGASAAICAAPGVCVAAVVAWVPDANTEDFTPGPDGYVEEGGQRVGNAFWEEAHAVDVARALREVTAPSYLVFGTDDEYVSAENREVLIAASGENVDIDVFENYPHSAWTVEQAADIIQRSTGFLASHLGQGRSVC